jgi:Fe-S-cluster containining protein
VGHICATCHATANGCCYLKESNRDNQIGLLISDIEKLRDYLNVDIDYFIVQDTVTDEFRESLSKSIHPIFDKIYYNNTAYRLKTVDNKCIFLRDTGCIIPDAFRPLYCRIYPFWLSADNAHIHVLSSYDCMAQNKSTLNWSVVNEHFNYSEEYIRNLFQDIIEAGDKHVASCITSSHD